MLRQVLVTIHYMIIMDCIWIGYLYCVNMTRFSLYHGWTSGPLFVIKSHVKILFPITKDYIIIV